MRKKMMFMYLLLILIPCSSLLAQSPIIDEEFISAGITVAETTSIRVKPDTGANVVQELEFGTPFLIFDKVPFYEKLRRWYWFKVLLLDGKTIGWVNSKQGREGNKEVIDLEKNDIAGLYYAVALRALWGFKEYSVAERLFNYILVNYPGKEIPIKDEEVSRLHYVNGNIGALNGLALLFKAKKEYHKAIEYYEVILRQEDIEQKEIVNTTRNIMLLYKEKIGDKEKTIKLCREIIRRFPDFQLAGFEWNLWVDIEAAEIIVEILSRKGIDAERLFTESDKILANTSNPPVILIATSGKIMSQIKSGEYETAKNTLLQIVQEYPNEKRTYFKTSVYFTNFAINDAIETIINEFGDYSKALDLLVSIKNRIEGEVIHSFLTYKTAQLLDEGNGDREQVVSFYEKMSNFAFWFPKKKIGVFPHHIQQRVERIKLFEVEEARVSKENAIIKPGLRSIPASYEMVLEGTTVNILYKDTNTANIDGVEGNWAKIQLENGKIGWIFDGFLSPVKQKHLFSPLSGQEQIWFTEGANFNRTSAINARPIKDPVIVKVFPDISSKEIVFSDVNDDRILDIITSSTKGLIAIDGKTHKTVWIFHCSNTSTPVIHRDLIYFQTFTDNLYLHVINKRTGELNWRIHVGSIRTRWPASSPTFDGRFIYIGTHGGVMAIDPTKRTAIWRYSTSSPVLNAIIYANNFVYFSGQEDFQGNQKLFALNAYTGELKWKFDFHPTDRQSYASSICIRDSIIYCNGANGYLYAIHSENGNTIWKKKLTNGRSTNWSKPAVSEDTVYYISPDNEIYALDSQTGKIKWKYWYSHHLWGNPAIVNSALYIRSIDSYLHAISTTDGELLWKIKVGNFGYGGNYSPSVAENLVFVCSTDHNLYVIGEKSESY